MDFATEALNQHEAMLRMRVRCPQGGPCLCFDGHDLDVTKVVMFRTVSNDFQPGEELDYDMLCFSPAGISSLKKNFPEFNQDKDHIYIGAFGATTVKAAGIWSTASIFRSECGALGRCPAAPWRILSRSSQKSDRTPPEILP